VREDLRRIVTDAAEHVPATAMRLLDAIPAVCAAKPGMLSPLDLPVYTTTHLAA